MKFRLFHQVFLLVTVSALAAEMAMVGALAVNLKSGFNAYLAARDAQDLDAFVRNAQTRLAGLSAPGELRGRPADLRALLDVDRVAVPPGPPPPPKALERFASPPPPPPPPEGQMGPPDDFNRRIALYDASGVRVAGPPPPSDPALNLPVQGRDIRVGGAVVGRVTVLPRPSGSHQMDSRFLDGQLRNAAVTALLVLILGALPAWGFARRLTLPLRRIQRATDSVAGGDFTIALPETGVVEVAETNRNINGMVAALRGLESARRRWLAEVSHELRTPLTSLRGELDALADGVRPLTLGAVASLNEEAVRLAGLVDDLHFLAMSDLAGPPCRFEAADALALCRQTIERFGDRARAAGLTLTLHPSGLESLPVVWDAGRIRQVLANLLTNSLRYSDAPGEIRLSVESANGRARITIDDPPPCPAPDQLPRLFEPLYRVEADRNRASGGSGMGLAICEAIVRAHRGVIGARKSAMGGLSVRIDMPMDAAA